MPIIHPDDPIRLGAHGGRHLPVVEGAELIGVVSVRDPLRVFADEWRRAAETRPPCAGSSWLPAGTWTPLE